PAWIWPPDLGAAALAGALGAAGAAGASAFMLTPGIADAVGRTPALTVGASAISVGSAGRSLCARVSVLNCLSGAAAGLAGCSTGASAVGVGVAPGDTEPAAGLVWAAVLDGFVALAWSWSGEGGRSMRTGSMVVFPDLSVTRISNRMSVPEGEYMILPLANPARSMSTFSFWSPSVMESTALLPFLMISASGFQVRINSPLARSTRNCN